MALRNNLNRILLISLLGAASTGLVTDALAKKSEGNLPVVFQAQVENPFAVVGDTSPLPPEPVYKDVSHNYSPENWKQLWDGADFQRVDVHRGLEKTIQDSEFVPGFGTLNGEAKVIHVKEKVDTIAIVRIDPRKTKMVVTSGCIDEETPCEYRKVEEWSQHTDYAGLDSMVIVNASYYAYDEGGHPRNTAVFNGKKFGTQWKSRDRAMIVDTGCEIDLLDKRYSSAATFTTPQFPTAVQGWPVLRDRKGKVRCRNSDWQANRSVVAKDAKGMMYVMTTEGGYFTLHNMGKFLGDLRKSGIDIVTAMNLDGGYEADMMVSTPGQKYTSYGYFETQGPQNNISFPIGTQVEIPTVLGFVPRDGNKK